ncbi:hypothetical protein HRbin36_02280 [bacterium HR36]|nr:hypothetical protein HRbin36_02280 [bacterium HR36]
MHAQVVYFAYVILRPPRVELPVARDEAGNARSSQDVRGCHDVTYLYLLCALERTCRGTLDGPSCHDAPSLCSQASQSERFHNSFAKNRLEDTTQVVPPAGKSRDKSEIMRLDTLPSGS